MSASATPPTDAALEAVLLDLLAALPEGKSIDPADVPKALLGETGLWRSHLKRVRFIAARLAARQRVTILRHGKPVAPEEMRGVIRLARGPELGEHRDRQEEENP